MHKILHPQIKEFSSHIKNQFPKLKASSKFVFICGAKPNKNTAREYIKEYAEKHLGSFQFFMAEEFFSSFENKETINLLTLETNLCKYSDCVLIVLEGPSAFAELGAFAQPKHLSKQVLVVNEKEHENSDSFIAKGPIAKINIESSFSPAIHADFSTILKSMPDIEKSLNTIKRVRMQKVKLKTLEEFSNCHPKKRLLFLSDIISLFGPIKLFEIYDILSRIYNPNANFAKFSDLADKELLRQIDIEISLLETLRIIEKKSAYFYKKSSPTWLFYHYNNFRPEKLRASVIVRYNKKLKDRANILSAKI